jgi:hypothetical protein
MGELCTYIDNSAVYTSFNYPYSSIGLSDYRVSSFTVERFKTGGTDK